MTKRIGLLCLCLGTILFIGCASDLAGPCVEGGDDGSGACAEGERGLDSRSEALGFHHRHYRSTFTVLGSVEPEGGGTVELSSRSHRARCEDGSCEVRFGSTVSLQATAADQFVFVRWSGCSDSTESAIKLRFIHEDRECIAHFGPSHINVVLGVTGMYRGQGRISAPGMDCGNQVCTVPYGTPVTLFAPSSPSYRFVGWEGCSTSTDPTLEISTETSNRTIHCIARMRAITFLVSWGVAPEGGGTIRRGHIGPDIYCGESSCEVVLGMAIGLEALPDAGYQFAGWSGCSDSTEPLLEVSDVREPRHCEAHFEPTPPTE